MKRLKPGNEFILLTVVVFAILSLQALGAFEGINKWVNSALPLVDTPWMRLLTALGGDAFLLAFSLLVIYFDLRERGRVSRRTVAFVGTVALGLLSVLVLKFAFAVPRPRPDYGTYAFPSGHTFRAAAIATYVSDRWRKYAPLAWAYAVGIALTRLFLHVHWFSDVLFSLFFAPWLYLLLKSLLGVEDE